METRANYIAVGLFSFAALVLAFGIAFWFGRYGDEQNMVPVDVRIQGSVSGLGAGSVVQFNGIDVGRVKALSFDKQDPRFVIVHAEVNAATPIRRDTRANIGVRGLSGGAFIQLEGGTPQAPSLLSNLDAGAAIPQIEGDPAALADLLTRINGIAARTDRVMNTLESFVSQNDQTVTRTLDNLEVFSKSLAANSEGVSKFMNSAGDVAISLERLSAKLDGSLEKVESILASVDPQRVSNTVENVEQFSKTLTDQREDIAKLVQSISDAANNLNTFSKDLSSTVAKVNGVVDSASGVVEAFDPTKVSSTIAKLEETASRANEILAAVDAQKLGAAVDNIGEAAAGAKQLMASVDATVLNTLMADLSSASASVSKIVSSLDGERINTAVDNIAAAAEGARSATADIGKVTSRIGSRADDIEQIVTDASELAARLNGTSKNIDGVIAKFDNLLGSGSSNGLIADARRTMAEFRQTARGLNARVAQVAGSIDRFTGRGLADTQGLIRDARQSLNRIDRVIRNLQENPSSLISGSGGSRVRESTGGRPRR